MRTEGVQQDETPAIDALRDLVERGAMLTVDTPAFELARWRASALYELAACIPPGHPAAGAMTASSAWILDETDPRQAERSLALGWAPLLGVLEAQLHRSGQCHPRPELVPPPRTPAITGKENGSEAPVAFPAGPYLQLLGLVGVQGAPGPVETRLLRSLTEYACWIHLNPGKGHHRLTRDLGRSESKVTRNAQTSRLRKWFGAEALPPILSDTGYAFSPSVTSDWTQFQDRCQLSRQSGETEAAHLHSALELVRGAPFGDVRSKRYQWALPVADAMTRAIVEAALRLAELRQTEHNLAQGLWALRRGFMAAGFDGMELDRYAPSYTSDWETLERGVTDLRHFLKEDPCLNE
ncbi:hypothetical protein AB0D94_22355 [Streptomyces sp. NPDC048255]|uniref:hypothetical protein n=1 Tax=Streptomyces sp. NPDC048255 TaxID=3154713 RepID=UPI0033F7C34F